MQKRSYRMQHRDMHRFWKHGAFRLEGSDNHFVMVGCDMDDYTADVIPVDKAKDKSPSQEDDMVFSPKVKFKEHVMTVDLDDLRPLKIQAGYSEGGTWVCRRDTKEWSYFLHPGNSIGSELTVVNKCPILVDKSTSQATINGWNFA